MSKTTNKIYKEITPELHERIRLVCIEQSGYGMDGCKLCGSRWERRSNMEIQDHKKDCIAHLELFKEQNENR